MSDAEYRAGDIAMVDGKPAVWVASRAGTYVWRYLNGAEPFGIEVGPVLGNVGDIAAMMTKAHEAFDEPIDLDDPYTVAYVKGRNANLDEIDGLMKQVRQAKAEGRREALAEVERMFPAGSWERSRVLLVAKGDEG